MQVPPSAFPVNKPIDPSKIPPMGNNAEETGAASFMEDVHDVLKRVVSSVTKEEGAQERLMAKPIDILCFGRAGVGKTTLLEGLTGRDLGSTPRLDHGTTKLECISVVESLPGKNGESLSVQIRFWDSKGIEKWSSTDVKKLFEELKLNEVHPLCVFYCATCNGRVDSQIVTSILRWFLEQDLAVFYLITNLYSHSDEQLDAQITGGLEVMTVAVGSPHKDIGDLVWQFGEKGFVMAVNSKPYTSRLGGKGPKNIDNLMEMCVSTLNEEQLSQFFLATLHNRNFWDKAVDKCRTIIKRLDKAGIDVRSFLQKTWGVVQEFVNALFA